MTVLSTTAYVQFDPGRTPQVSAMLRLTGSSCIQCCTYPDSAPILAINDAHVRVSLSVPDPGKVTEHDVAAARVLAAAVARYVAELERRTAASGQDDASGQARDDSNAGGAVGAGTSGRPGFSPHGREER